MLHQTTTETVRPGDDLYTSCLLAIDPDTGKLKWHFQFTPHDLYDYDAVGKRLSW